MRKIILFLITVLALTTAATAFESATPYIGCPKYMPGCPGYKAANEFKVSTGGPQTITGNPRTDQGTWPNRRNYQDSCYWAEDGGLTCMQQGQLPPTTPKRFRRAEMVETQSDTMEREEVQAPEKLTDSTTMLSGKLGGRFGWRGYAPRLRDMYAQY